MIDPDHFRDARVQELSRLLATFDREQTLAKVSSLLTIPSLQGNAYRLELLAQLAVCACTGRAVPDCAAIESWLNDYLGHVAWVEDPPEDVFVSNVITAQGDFRVTTGMWEVSDFATSLLIQTLEATGGDDQLEWLNPAYALLKLSDALLQCAMLPRWELQPTNPKQSIRLAEIEEIRRDSDWAKRTVFETSQLADIGIDSDLLEPFVFDLANASALTEQNNQESELHRRPLVRQGSRLLISIPSALVYAARRYIVQRAVDCDQLRPLEDALTFAVTDRVDDLMRSGSRHSINPVALPNGLGVAEDLCRSLVYRIGGRRFIHLVVFRESLDTFARNGLNELHTFGADQLGALDQHVSSVREYLESSEEVDSGHTLLLLGNLGQGFLLIAPPSRDRWSQDFCRLADLTLLLRASGSSLDKLILMLNQEAELASRGLAVLNVNGLLNLHSYWIQQGFHLLTPDFPVDRPGGIQLATDFLTSFRRDQRRSYDEHCQLNIRGYSEVVQRANPRAIYPVLESLPAYVSTSALSARILKCCIELEASTVWMTMQSDSDSPSIRHMCFKLWEGLQLVVYRALVSLPRPPSETPTLELIFDFRAIKDMQAAQDDPGLAADLSLHVHKALPAAKLVAAPGFLRHFASVENGGEQLLISQVLNAVRLLWGLPTLNPNQSRAAAREVLGGVDAKIIHGFQKYHEIEYLIDSQSRPVFRRPKEHLASCMRTALADLGHGSGRIAFDQMQSRDILNRGVTRFAHRLVAKLARFDRHLLIRDLLSAHETLLRDKRRWRSSARAIRALYGVEDATATAHEVEQERAESTLTLRILVEAALCSCPQSGGIQPDGYSVDELYGLACALISAGRDSEIVHFGLASEGITVHPSGAYAFNADILQAVGGRYAVESFGDTFASASAEYEDWAGVSRPSDSTQLPDKFTTEAFRAAFQAEYSLTLETLIEIVNTLMECCVRRKDVVVAMSHDELLAAVAEHEVSSSDLEAFLTSFSLTPRPTWIPQPPVRPRDVEPWQFERRLSVMLRPVIDCGEELLQNRFVYGAATLRESIGYVLDSITNGLFDTTVFASVAMRSYVGSRVDELGADFTKAIASDFGALGWETKTQVTMAQLGAPKHPNLGDIDVLAWKSDGTVLAIECKRLKGARSISEIAQHCDRFRGNEGDHLHKHLRRIEWLRANPEVLAVLVGRPPSEVRLRAPLVTNSPVPFRYLKDLPMAASDVVPRAALNLYLAQL